MYKLKNSYIDKMIEQKATSREIDFLLYIARSQDVYGEVHSVYYRLVCDAIGISIQKYYDILSSLSQKGLISCHKDNAADVCVKLVDNDFSAATSKADNDPSAAQEAFNFGYFKVGEKDFSSDRFRNLKAGAKLLFLYFQRFPKGKHMLLGNFYSDYSRMLAVTPRSLRGYIKELRDSKLLGVGLHRNKSYNYEINLRRTSTLNIKMPYIPTENDLYRNNLEDLIRANFKSYIPDGTDKPLRDISSLLLQQRGKTDRGIFNHIVMAIKRSITQQKGEGNAHPIINAALVNKWFTEHFSDSGDIYGYACA